MAPERNKSIVAKRHGSHSRKLRDGQTTKSQNPPPVTYIIYQNYTTFPNSAATWWQQCLDLYLVGTFPFKAPQHWAIEYLKEAGLD